MQPAPGLCCVLLGGAVECSPPLGYAVCCWGELYSAARPWAVQWDSMQPQWRTLRPSPAKHRTALQLTTPHSLEAVHSCSVAVLVLPNCTDPRSLPPAPHTAPLATIMSCRLEALRSCSVAVLVLTQGYVTSSVFGLERDLALARLVAAQREVQGA